MPILSNAVFKRESKCAILQLKVYDAREKEDITLSFLAKINREKIGNEYLIQKKLQSFIEELTKWFYSNYVAKRKRYSEKKLMKALERIMGLFFPRRNNDEIQYCLILCCEADVFIKAYKWDGVFYFAKGLVNMQMHKILDKRIQDTPQTYFAEWEKGNCIFVTRPFFLKDKDTADLSGCFCHEDIIDDYRLKKSLGEVLDQESSYGLALIKV